jgi:hypothetical protein
MLSRETVCVSFFQAMRQFSGDFRDANVNKVDGEEVTSKRSFFSSCRREDHLYNKLSTLNL